MTQGDSDPDEAQFVKYEVADEVYTAPDEHRQVADGVFVAEYSPDIDNWEGAGMIEVLEWDYDDDEPPKYSGDPEITEGSNGRLWIAVPDSTGDSIKKVDMGHWVCDRCGHDVEMGPIFRGMEVRKPEECPGCDRQSNFSHYAATFGTSNDTISNLMTTEPLWKPPSGVGDVDVGAIWDAVYDHIYEHWDASGRDWLYEGLTAYAMGTWLRPAFDFVPHLLIIGKHETGKTRLLNTLKGVSYRCVHTTSASPSSVFRGIDGNNITLYMSEYHDLDQETQQTIDSVIKAGQKRGEVILRAEESLGGGYSVNNFNPFTHVAISTQFDPRDDIRSRCFEIQTRPSDRSMPRTLDDTDHILDDLLAMRYELLDSPRLDEAQAAAEAYMDENNLFNRLSEKLWSLITVSELADRDISNFIEHAVESSAEDKSESDEAHFIRAVIDEAFKVLDELDADDVESDDLWDEADLKITRIRRRFNDMTGRDVSNQFMGSLRKRLGFEKARKSDGTYISDPNLKEKLRRVASENNVEWQPSPDLVPSTEGDEANAQDQRRQDIKGAINSTSGLKNPSPERVIGCLEGQGYEAEFIEHDINKMLEEGTLVETPDGSLALNN